MKYPNKKNFPIVFDSKYSKKATETNLKLEIKISDEELNQLISFYQHSKKNNLTTKLSLEQFIKELIFNKYQEYHKIIEEETNAII